MNQSDDKEWLKRLNVRLEKLGVKDGDFLNDMTVITTIKIPRERLRKP